jgi:hypothetical protein
MRVPKVRLAALALVSGLALSGCAYDMYGDNYGYGPYGGIGVGIGYGDYGYGYPYGGYGYPYGYYGSYGYDPFGWYGDYYYPGAGVYVYDRYRTRHVWSDDQRRYWEQRRNQWQNHSGTNWTGSNWSGWDRSHWRDHGSMPTTTGVTAGSDTSWNRGSPRFSRVNDQPRSSPKTSSDRSNRGHRREPGDDRH